MILYHGTNCEIRKPDPRKGHRGTDFGQGFYLTPDMESARNMASLVVAREGTGCRTINVFELDDAAARLAGLKVRKFEDMDENWIRFVIANRNFEWDASDHNLDQLYDVVVGFIADDKIRNLIRMYRDGLMTPAMMLSIMKDRPWRVIQYSFHTLRSVRFLKLKEVWHEQ